tara:strand:+ start:239 stop:670 length:432 start_codon:yes stop_codon:yes gene_type:complete
MGDFKLSKRSKKNIKDVRKTIIEMVTRVLVKSDHDFGIPNDGGKRTAQEQNNLYHLRVNGNRVTWLDGFNKLSFHQSGDAVDIFIYDEHGACWACIEKYKHVADLMKLEFELMKEEGLFKSEEKLVWGGDWRRKDLPHFEVRQ